MGCTSSKDSAKDRKIDSEFPETKLAKFDEIFSKASTILKNCEDIRDGIESSKEDGEEIAGTDLLKEGKYSDTLTVLLWAFSAQGKGKINDLELKITNELPYIDVDEGKLTEDTRKLYNTFCKYGETAIGSFGKMKESVEALVELVQLIPAAMEEAFKAIAELDFKAKFEAMSKIKKCATKLPKEVAKCKVLFEVIKTAAQDLKDTIPKLYDMVKNADDIGAKAHAANLIEPKEIFLKYHTGERKVVDPKKEEKK